MIICLDKNNYILWYHDDDSIKQQDGYIDDESIILSKLTHNDIPVDPPDNEYVYRLKYFNDTDVPKWIKQGPKIPNTTEGLCKIISNTKVISDDILMSMELGVETNNHIKTTQEDNLLNMEMLVTLQNQINTLISTLNTREVN